MGTQRGGIERALYYEWGGRNSDDSWGFDTNRPTWAMPIHQLMAANNVTIFFQGHDHLFAKEELDGVVYLELPQPADYEVDGTPPDNADRYSASALTLTNGGHVRVTVSADSVLVEYVRTQIAADGVPNGRISHAFTIPGNSAVDSWRLY
jgi:hypothetical protein